MDNEQNGQNKLKNNDDNDEKSTPRLKQNYLAK